MEAAIEAERGSGTHGTMRKILPAMACLFLAMRPANAQDPYGATIRQQAIAELGRSLENAAQDGGIVYFAQDCGVLSAGQASTISSHLWVGVQHDWQRLVVATHQSLPLEPYSWDVFQGTARVQGRAMAQRHGGCVYFSQHPDLVLRLREMAAFR